MFQCFCNYRLMFILHIQKPIASPIPPTEWLDSPDHLRQQNQTSEQQWRTGGGRSLPDRSLPPAVCILNSPFPLRKWQRTAKRIGCQLCRVSSWPDPGPHFLGVHLGELRLRDLRVGRRRQVPHGQAVVAGVARVGRHEHEQNQQHHGRG